MTDDAYSSWPVISNVLQVMFVPLFSPLTSTISFVIISAAKSFLIVTLTRLAVKLPMMFGGCESPKLATYIYPSTIHSMTKIRLSLQKKVRVSLTCGQ